MATALMTMSFTETLNWSPAAVICSRSVPTFVMSISDVRKNVGMGPMLSPRRRAIVLRICVSATSLNSPSICSAVCTALGAAEMLGRGAAATPAGATAGAAVAAASMSRLMTRPPGPVPLMAWRLSPFSAAMRRARGELRTGPPGTGAGVCSAVPAGGCACSIASTGGAGMALAGTALGCSDGASVGATAGGPPASAEMSSSAAAMTPIVTPTGLVAPSSMRRARRMPSPRATSSMIALSVSTSASVSPFFTASPTFFTHFTRRPSSMVGESASIITLVAIWSPVG